MMGILWNKVPFELKDNILDIKIKVLEDIQTQQDLFKFKEDTLISEEKEEELIDIQAKYISNQIITEKPQSIITSINELSLKPKESKEFTVCVLSTNNNKLFFDMEIFYPKEEIQIEIEDAGSVTKKVLVYAKADKNTKGNIIIKVGNLSKVIPYKIFKTITDIRDVIVYPNPLIRGNILNFIIPEGKEICLRVYDISGNLVKKEEGRYNSGLSLDVKDLSSGIYIYCIEDKQTHTQKIAKFVIIH
jgi:hypothetical protein